MTFNTRTPRKSTFGRPRRLTDAQVHDILKWYCNRRSFKQVARHYGVSVSTLKHIIETHGEYKQISPELRTEAKARRLQRIADLRVRHFL